MRTKLKYAVTVAALLAGTMTLGCQLPFSVAHRNPSVEIYYGKMEAKPSSNLSLKLDFRQLLQSAGYSVKALDYAVVEVKVTGDGLAEPMVASTNTVECPGGTATFNFDDLPVGQYAVHLTVKDAQAKTLAYAYNKDVPVADDARTVVDLECRTDLGGITVNFTCHDLCAAPSPSPTPTPTPTPTPMPSPADPQTIGFVSGFTVDEAENIYLLGFDPGFTPYSLSTNNAPAGRFIKIRATDLHDDGVIYDNNVGSMVEAEVHNNVLLTVDPNNIHRTDLATNTTTLSGPFQWGGAGHEYERYPCPPFNGICITNAGDVLWGFGSRATSGESGRWESGVWAENHKAVYWYGGDSQYVLRPWAMDYDKVNNRVILASYAGLFWMTPDLVTNPFYTTPNPNDHMLLDLRGTTPARKALGMVLMAPDASSALLSFWNERNIAVWESGTGLNATAAFTLDFGYPSRFVKGENGKYYALVFKTAVNYYENVAGYYDKDYRVIRFDYDAATKKLVNPTLLVDTMPDQPASFAAPTR